MATAIGRARSTRAALISTLAITALALSAGAVSAAPPAALTTDVASLDFGTVLVTASSTTQQVVVTAGRKDVIFQADTNRGEYQIAPSSTCLQAAYQLAAGTSCTIDIVFTPLIADTVTATLTLDTCMKSEVVLGLPHCLRIKDTVGVSLSAVVNNT